MTFIATGSTATDTARMIDRAHFRSVMALLAIGTVVLGSLIGFWHDGLGLSAAEGREIASVFLIAGVADTLVLYFWDTLFRSNGV